MSVGLRGFIAQAMSETVTSLQQVAYEDVRTSQDRVEGSKEKAKKAKEKKRGRNWFGRTFLKGSDDRKIKKAEIEVQEQQLVLGEAQRTEQGAAKMDQMVSRIFSKQFQDSLQGKDVT